jgi:tRNA(adenine34) deaminase
MKKVRRRVSVVVIHQDCLLAFHAEDPTNGRSYIFVPGGLIEDGESCAEAAVRETVEETGYQIRILPMPAIERHYDFEWDGQLNACETIFLAGELEHTQAQEINDAHYHRGVTWVPLSKMTEAFSYHKDILEPILTLTSQIINK